MKERDHTTLDSQLAEFYGSLELPKPVVAEILGSADNRLPARHPPLIGALSAAAALMLIAAIGMLLQGDRPEDITDLAMAEVVKNHLKGIGPEAVTADYAVVQDHLSRLTFSVQPPAGSLVDDFDLIGGRYCKVQGIYAAQLKLRPRQGGPAATAYIVPAEGDLAVIKDDASVVIDGVRVRCERSGNRLIFLAEAAQAE